MKIVDYWAEWCSPCRKYTPIIESVAAELEITLVKVELKEGDSIKGITALPTTRLYANNDADVINDEPSAQREGAMSKVALKKWIADAAAEGEAN